MNRFKIVFNHSGSISPQLNNLGGGMASIGRQTNVFVNPKNMALNAPMIERVHNAKPGCSACGKKAA